MEQNTDVEIYDFIIPEYALCAIVNGDYEGLTGTEVSKVEYFIKQYGDTCSINGESFFSWHNDIDGNLGATCYDMQFVQIK